MGDEKITIGLTCYNAERTIGKAICSALAQDYPNYEVIIVDDASTDSSYERINKFVANNSHVRLIRHKENLGPAGARNTILEHSTGSYLAFFDDDDESYPHRLTVQLEKLKAQEAVTPSKPILCFASGSRRYRNGYEKKLPAIGSRGVAPSGSSIADYLLLNKKKQGYYFGSGVPTCALMISKWALETISGFDESLRRVEDADLAIRLGFKGAVFIGVQEELFFQNATEGGDKTYEKNLYSERLIVKKHKPYLKKLGLYYHARRWPYLRYWHFKRTYSKFLLELLGLTLANPIYTIRHLLDTGPRRIQHELQMHKPTKLGV